MEELTLGPFYSLDRHANGDWDAHFLVPFGVAHAKGKERRYWLVPLASFEKRLIGDGENTNWSFLSLIGLIARGGDTRPTRVGWFPFFMRFDDFLVWDELTTVMFPLYARAKVKDRVANHVLWPIFSFINGPGDSGFRVWPLYGRSLKEGRYDRTFWLWPFFHVQENFLGGGGEEPERMFMFWPFFGRSRRGTFEANTVLWPFFGYSEDSRNGGMWALDAPWLFVRFQKGPGEFERKRVWPIFGWLKTPGFTSFTFLWPLGHVIEEDNDQFEKKSYWFFPIWQWEDRKDKKTGREDRWRKLWPVAQFESQGEAQRGSFPALDPFPPNQLYDRHYGWLTKLWEWENGFGGIRRERSWGGIYRRERTPAEDRRSISGLWSRRSIKTPEGGKVTETSLCFGLLRWQSSSDSGFGFLPPAFPGPGWPALEGVPEGARELQRPFDTVDELTEL